MSFAIPLLPAIISAAAGAMLVIQAPINAKLGTVMGGPLVGAFLSFFTGTIVLGIMLMVMRKSILVANITQTQIWMWIGGTLGAALVFTTVYAVPKLGTASMIALIISGQILFSLITDHFGFLLPNAIPVTPARILGALLLLAGVGLIIFPKI